MTSARTLLAVTLGALALRLVGIGFGPYHPDEHLIINHALALGAGDLNPHLFYFPSFFMYLLFAVYGIFYLLGHWAGQFRQPDDFLTLYLVSPQVFYVLARLVSAFFGTAAVPLAYWLGKEYKNARTGLAAAILVAVNFLHARDSHFATMDIALTFFMTLSIYLLMKSLGDPKGRAYYGAVFTAGVAAAVKYNGFVLAIPIAVVYLFTKFRKNREKGRTDAVGALFLDGVKSGLVMLAAFFLFSPYVLLDYRASSEFIGKLYELNRAFHVSWAAHAGMLYNGLGLPLFVAVIMGCVWDLWRGPAKSHTRAIVLGVYFISYYVMITRAGQPFERYILPLVPICIVWAASFLDLLGGGVAAGDAGGRAPAARTPSEARGGTAGYRRRQDPRLRFRILCGLLVVLSLPKTLYSDYLFLRKDTRALAREWIRRQIPSGSVVVMDDPGQSPKLPASRNQVLGKLALLKEGDPLLAVKRRRLERMLSLEPYPAPSYNLYYLADSKPKSDFSMLGPLVPYDVSALKEVRAEYLVTNSQTMILHPDFYELLKKNSGAAAQFDPRRDTARPMGPAGWTYLTIDDFLWNYDRPGPRLFIFKIRRP